MLDQRLNIRSAQGLSITKSMQQSIKILQMNSFDLEEFIAEKVLENPFIERIDNTQQVVKEDPRYESVKLNFKNNISVEEYIDYSRNHKISLKEHLHNQIMIEITDPKEKLIALRCTDSIDENGYLKEPVAKIVENLKCPTHEIKTVLSKLQKLDPAGVYAKDLAECLALQLKDQGVFDKTYELILNKLELIVSGKLTQLSKCCGVNIEELKKRISIIKKLSPKPGINYSNDLISTLVPDVHIYFDHEGYIKVSLNDSLLPKIQLNNTLYQQSLSNTEDQEGKAFCKNKFYEATSISKALGQRAQTIYKVASIIAKEQSEFFEKGINFLKPMILSDIANLSNLHESTISRISNKVIASPVGTFEIKHFFTSKIKSNFAENIYSSASVKNQIKALIENESSNILADDKISLTLKARGIEISRRTVTKYREEMRLPSSHERKRLKSNTI